MRKQIIIITKNLGEQRFDADVILTRESARGALIVALSHADGRREEATFPKAEWISHEIIEVSDD